MNIEDIKRHAAVEIKTAKNVKSLEAIRLKYLGRKGALTTILRGLKDMGETNRKTLGATANLLKNELERTLSDKMAEFRAIASSHNIDVTAPGHRIPLGHLHPLTLVERDIKNIFTRMGFAVIDGPEIETEYYNFDALNIPADHPAREMWDTFWIKEPDDTSKRKRERYLLRTHTSPVQIRYMETHEPPLQIIVPGRVFRYEATDASHETNFYQVEGLMVSRDVSLANFKYVIEEFLKQLFVKDIKVRFRPSYFPFVEPGLEVDISCVKCSGKGCSICQKSGWVEIMGAGMVHRHVFEYAHYNPSDWQGFAFGFGLDRIAMLKYNIPDIRLFYNGDLRFVKQFK